MRDEEFITEVQTRAGLSSRAAAERVTYATLAVLGEQLPDSVAGAVAAALPEQLGEQLWGRGARSRATGAQAGRLSRGVERGEGSWPGDNTSADADIDAGDLRAADRPAVVPSDHSRITGPALGDSP